MSLNPAVAAGAQVASRRRNGPARRRRARGRRNWAGWGFVGPFMVVFAFALIVPIGYAIYLSLYRQQLIGGNAFVGIDNYKTALSDPQFWASLRRVLLFLVVQVPIMTVLALLAALALDSARLRWTPLYRLSIFLPYAVPAVVASLMWGFIYGSQFGLVARLRSFFGGHFPDPLSSDWALSAIGNVVTWEFVGYNMLILYSALQAVPRELYEAAEIDGATQFGIIRWVKLPAIRVAIVVSLIFSVIGSVQLFNEPNILNQLAPDAITKSFTPNMYAYNLSFAGQEYNYSAAIAIVMGILTVIIAAAVQWYGRRRTA
ncbi:MAG TPA: sugar ABC transporter permease [Trebonia sp.]|jgi:multiple sugar transport system permease protein|nr:sugar ABC transporter permease [Trebonia sp.]